MFAFSIGMCCALVLREFYFDAKPIVRVQTSNEPTTQILVAAQTIPGGIEITGEFVVFQNVPISEVPIGAIANFNHVYRRQPAFPIPEGCPICEDLLLPFDETIGPNAFVPAGSQFVNIDLVNIRLGNKDFPQNESVASVLADQRVDIRVVPRHETPGRLAEIKNQVLRTFSQYDFRNSGDLILENVPIQQIQRKAIPGETGSAKDSLVLMLNQNEAAQLAAAAREGQLRVLVHQGAGTHRNESTTQPVPLPMESNPALGNAFAIAERQPTMQPTIQPMIPSATLPVGVQEHPHKTAPLPKDITDWNNTHRDAAPASKTHVGQELEQPNNVVVPGIQEPVVRVSESNVSESKESEHREMLANRNHIPMLYLGTPAQRMVSTPLPKREMTRGEEDVLQQSDSGIGHSDVALGTPRIIQSIQFIATGSEVRPSGFTAAVSEVAETSLYSASPTSSSASLVALPGAALPGLPVSSVSSFPPERESLPGYSPFERRAFTVPLNGVGDESLAQPTLLKTF